MKQHILTCLGCFERTRKSFSAAVGNLRVCASVNEGVWLISTQIKTDSLLLEAPLRPGLGLILRGHGILALRLHGHS